MKAFEVYCGDVISGLKVHWRRVGRPYVLIGHPSSGGGTSVPLSNALLERIGFGRVDRITECDLSYDDSDHLVLVPATTPAPKSILVLVTYHDWGFPNYRYELNGSKVSEIVHQEKFKWHIGDGLHERGLSSLVKLHEGDSLEVAQKRRRHIGYDGPFWKYWLGFSKDKYEIVRKDVGRLTVGGSGQELVYTRAKKKRRGNDTE